MTHPNGKSLPSWVAANRNYYFDLLPPIARECAYALFAKYGAHPRLIYTAILGALSSAIGPSHVFKPPDREARLISSWTMLSFPSGSSKTDIYRELAKPFQAFAEERRRHYAAASAAHTRDVEQWKFEVKELERTLSRKSLPASDRPVLDTRLLALRQAKPRPPKERPFIINDFDHESFMAVADGENEAIAIMPNEGDHLLRGRWISRHVSVLNDIHDGVDPPQYRREKKPALEAIQAFVSFNIYTRPSVTGKFQPIYKRDSLVKHHLMEDGFLARFRVAIDDGQWRPSLLYRPEDPDARIAEFQHYLVALLGLMGQDASLPNPRRIQIQLDEDAVVEWSRLVHKVKVAQANEWAHIDAFAGKALVHLGSLAVALHLPESDSPLISRDALLRGWEFTCDFAHQYGQAFMPPPPQPVLNRDAARVEEYLRINWGQVDYSKVDLEHMSFMLGIPKQRILAVAHHLVHHGLGTIATGNRALIDVSLWMGPTRRITFR